MKHHKFSIGLTIATALALVACGGGGGSTSEDSGTETTADTTTVSKPPKDGKLNYTKVDASNLKVLVDTKEELIVEITTNGDVHRFREFNPDSEGFFQSGTQFLNGVEINETNFKPNNLGQGNFDMGQLGSTYFAYNGKNGPSAAYNGDVEEAPFAPGVIFPVANNQRATSFSDVYYKYSVSNGDGTWTDFKGADGKITFDPNTAKWGASLGGDKVKLDGQLEGNVVSGTAKYQNLDGTFYGNDLYADNSDKYFSPFEDEEGLAVKAQVYHYSAGGYAGSDGYTTFAGVWGQTDNPDITSPLDDN